MMTGRMIPVPPDLVEPGDDLIAMRVVGNCMAPGIEPGDFVIVARGAAWSDGAIVVAVALGLWYVKRAYHRGGDVVLRADAPGWPEVHGASVVGVVRVVSREIERGEEP